MSTNDVNTKPGLRAFKTSNPKSCTPPNPESKTQKRKAALRSYNVTERKGGRTQASL